MYILVTTLRILSVLCIGELLQPRLWMWSSHIDVKRKRANQAAQSSTCLLGPSKRTQCIIYLFHVQSQATKLGIRLWEWVLLWKVKPIWEVLEGANRVRCSLNLRTDGTGVGYNCWYSICIHLRHLESYSIEHTEEGEGYVQLMMRLGCCSPMIAGSTQDESYCPILKRGRQEAKMC